jgi:sulfur-oxidizing protein SoxZ
MSSIKIRLKRIEDSTLVRLLINHPMETGRRIDLETGELIPAHFINKLIVTHQDRVIASCALGPGVSKDPYFSFRFKNGNPGDFVTVTWTDNLGYSDRDSARVQ